EPARGKQGERDLIELYRGAFPDLRFTVDEQVVEGDKVATRWTARGTHEGDLRGIPPTHRAGAASGITIATFRDGKLVSAWTMWYVFGLFSQLGIVPQPA